MNKAGLIATVLLAVPGFAAAQGASPPASPTTAPAGASAPASSTTPATDAVAADTVPGQVVLPTGTLVHIELAEAVSSQAGHRGDTFAIRLVAPITVGGRVLAPAGTTGGGEIVYAEAGGAGGSPGKLVLAARYLDVGGVRVRLKAFNLAAAGDVDFRELQVAGEFLGPAVMFINGHNVVYPVGTRAHAKVAEDATLPQGPPTPDADRSAASNAGSTPASAAPSTIAPAASAPSTSSPPSTATPSTTPAAHTPASG